MSSNLLSGAKILLNCLVRENVDIIFGYPGGVTIPLYDALYDHPIKHILVRHEQNAAFSAQGSQTSFIFAQTKIARCPIPPRPRQQKSP